MASDLQLSPPEAPQKHYAGPTRRVWARFRRNSVGVTATIVVALFFIVALVTGLCAWSGVYFPYDPNATNLAG